MSSASEKTGNPSGPSSAKVDGAIEQLNTLPENEELARRATQSEGAIAFASTILAK